MKIFEIEVNNCPPIKDGANSVFNEKHRHFPRVKSLQLSAREKMKGTEIFITNLGIAIENYGCPGDADNIIGGILDSLENIVLKNDNQFVEVKYKLLKKEGNFKYKVKIWKMD